MLIRLLFVLVIAAIALSIALMVKNPGDTHKILKGDLDQLTISEEFKDWVEFHSVIGNFKVYFPSSPEHMSKKLPIPGSDIVLSYEIYTSERENGSTFMINEVTYPDVLDTSDQKDLLENVMSEMLVGDGLELVSSQHSDYRGFPSLNFLVEDVSAEALIQNTVFTLGQKLYLLNFVDYKETFRQEEFDFFLDSFRLLDVHSLGEIAE